MVCAHSSVTSPNSLFTKRRSFCQLFKCCGTFLEACNKLSGKGQRHLWITRASFVSPSWCITFTVISLKAVMEIMRVTVALAWLLCLRGLWFCHCLDLNEGMKGSLAISQGMEDKEKHTFCSSLYFPSAQVVSWELKEYVGKSEKEQKKAQNVTKILVKISKREQKKKFDFVSFGD